MSALQQVSHSVIPLVPCHSLKPFWNEELDRLKSDSVFWHNLWISAGKPTSGMVQHIRLSCKAKYKLAIRNAFAIFEDSLTDEMCTHFTNKKIPEFWKSWNAKFRKNVNKHVTINGYTDMQALPMNLQSISTRCSATLVMTLRLRVALLVSVISFWLVTIILATSVLTM